MNKQDALKELNAKKERNEAIVELDDYTTGYKNGFGESINDTIFIVKQIDEPEKPVVPQFVADWYEDNKADLEYNIYRLSVAYNHQELTSRDLSDWFGSDSKNKPIETLIKMKLFDYEVKKEKLYQVEIPSNMEGCYYALVRDHRGRVVLGKYDNDLWKALDSTKLTEKEIKRDYAWTWGLHFCKEVEE